MFAFELCIFEMPVFGAKVHSKKHYAKMHLFQVSNIKIMHLLYITFIRVGPSFYFIPCFFPELFIFEIYCLAVDLSQLILKLP